MEIERKQRAGFWIKSCARLIDLALVAVVVVLIAEAVGGWGLYIPIEIVVVVAYVIYTGVAVGWKGRTLGEAALGTRVTRRDGGSVGWVRAFVRAGTVVICQEGLRTRRRLAFATVMTLVGVYVAFSAFSTYRLYRLHRDWTADADAAARRTQSGPKDTIDAASVDAAQRTQMAAWLGEHGDDPAKTVIDLAANHQVTIIGEIHCKKPYLEFFNEVIPDLYSKAAVRVLAIEYCHPVQNGDLDRLVNGRQFDRGLLMAVARRTGWRSSGDKEYWDILETVWRVNQSRPRGSDPLRVVGISPWFDGPSIVLLRGGPWYERLRIVRPAGLVRMTFFGDAYYARCVERAAFDDGRRTVVWVGASHAALSPSSRTRGNDGVGGNHHMASMLVGRYGSAVGQVILHADAKTDRVVGLIEESARQCSRTRVSFAVADSPFARLRDDQAFGYRFTPGCGLADLASHYIMLTPSADLQECDWMEDFLTRRMLGRNRPYYELLAGGHIDDLADRRVAEGARRL